MFRNVPSRYAKARLLPSLMLRPSGFLYNPRNAESYSLSPEAACLEGLQRGEPPDELWRQLVGRFEVSEPLAHRDTLQFLSTLHQLGLLTLDEAEQAAAEQDPEDGDQDGDQDRDPDQAAPTASAGPAQP
jgi:hypothetical protein